MLVASVGLASIKEGGAAMLIGNMDKSRLMVYVQQVEEEKMRNDKSIGTRKLRLGMSMGNKNVVQIDHNFRNKRGMHPKTKVSIMAKTRRTSELDQHNLNVVWHKEVVSSCMC